MALGATIYRLQLGVADIDAGHYAEHSLTLARHPSETEERLMMRVLAFTLFAAETPQFGRGLSTDDEPDLWVHTLSGEISRWIDVGLPEERRLRRACGRASQVVALVYGGSRADVWWERMRAPCSRLAGLRVLRIPADESMALAGLASRSMQLSATLQDGTALFSDGARSVSLTPQSWWAGERSGAPD